MRHLALAVVVTLLASHLAAPPVNSESEVRVGLAYTTDRLNLRAGPGQQYTILQVLPYHATIEVSGAARYGYYPVSYQSSAGWASGEFLRPAGRATTTSTLNLRQRPDLAAPVLLILPLGAEVRINGPARNRFSPVSYSGLRGWASNEYLSALFPVPDTPAFEFPWPRGLSVWLTSGPHNGLFPIGSVRAPMQTRNALDFGRGTKSWPVLAATSGTVVRVGCYLPGSEGLGCMVEIDHGGGWQSLYGHLRHDPVSDVGLSPGGWVSQGQLIGHTGRTGKAYGVHLHLELRRGGHYVDGFGWKKGRRQGLDGLTIDGWLIHASTANYHGSLTRPGYARRVNSDCRWTWVNGCPRNDVPSTNDPAGLH